MFWDTSSYMLPLLWCGRLSISFLFFFIRLNCIREKMEDMELNNTSKKFSSRFQNYEKFKKKRGLRYFVEGGAPSVLILEGKQRETMYGQFCDCAPVKVTRRVY